MTRGKGKSDNEHDEKRKKVDEEFIDKFTYIWIKNYCAKMSHINVIIKLKNVSFAAYKY